MEGVKKQLYDLLVSCIVNNKVETEEGVEGYISQFKGLPMFAMLTEDDIEDIRRRIKAEHAIKLEIGALIESTKHEKWFLSSKANLDMRYWERYKKYLLQSKNFKVNVVNSMDDILDVLTDLLGNPNRQDSFQRRGLIIGDVQSGKTANYTGLICKAADAGYKVVVLLTGTIEKLRRQTQLRIDEGFVGMDSFGMMKQKENCVIGVGVYDPSAPRPMVLTSTYDDFKARNASNLGFNLETINGTVIFVIKKNVSILKHLNNWLRTQNLQKGEVIDHSLLLIDDEADNASVNTNDEETNPTAINGQIRQLLAVFKRASYVGFTATPFANIFIDPENKDKMEEEDLFPKDYIYSLNAPTNYIGARNIFDEEGEHKDMLVEIDKEEMEKIIPEKHKSTLSVTSIPDDMKEAIDTFLMANVIRDIRGDINTHRSMLINVSRFTKVQQQIGDVVNAYLKDVQAATRIYCASSKEQALQNEGILSLYKAFKEQYSHLEVKWEEIQSRIYKSIVSIQVVVINQDSPKQLNYDEYERDGMRVIAIGGLSLSRGLTLEGLMVSYFYRNSKMYDTLMQMGRWFGYRSGYEDLCRIWMTEDSIEWYRHISEATDELRAEVKKYEDSGLTPLDFGLRVRSDINALLVTARNKMRTAAVITRSISLSEEIIETPEIYTDLKINKDNMLCVQQLIESIKTYGECTVEHGMIGFKDIPQIRISEFLSKMNISPKNIGFDADSIKSFMENYRGAELKKWDIAFASGTSEKPAFEVDDTHRIKLVRRSFSIDNNGKIVKMSGSKRRLGSSGDGRFGLDDAGIQAAKYNAERSITRKSSNPIQRDYFINIKRNPLLVIYLIDLNENKNKGENKEMAAEIKDRFADTPLIGVSIGIPTLSDTATKYARYTINKIEQMLMEEDDDMGDED